MYFWGFQAGHSSATPIPIAGHLGNVVDVAATRDCEFSVIQTNNTTIYFWGKWHKKNVDDPQVACLSTIDEVFAAADPPVLYGTVEFPGRGQRISDKMKAAFDDKVRC